ncbi:prostatic spermine-binding protein-like [Ricinus communis]|uniref:prostatic spermine-binding protein-like n=1 Tax=Ricinus communis TaxID=3988 RepID=UPI00201A8346|nr:prostatic spermine-binding protein-like [Ricinus communis]
MDDRRTYPDSPYLKLRNGTGFLAIGFRLRIDGRDRLQISPDDRVSDRKIGSGNHRQRVVFRDNNLDDYVDADDDGKNSKDKDNENTIKNKQDDVEDLNQNDDDNNPEEAKENDDDGDEEAEDDGDKDERKDDDDSDERVKDDDGNKDEKKDDDDDDNNEKDEDVEDNEDEKDFSDILVMIQILMMMNVRGKILSPPSCVVAESRVPP